MTDREQMILLKMLRYCEQIEETHRQFQEDQAMFFSEEAGFVYRNAVSMPILQIGELAKHLSEEFRAANRQIPWRAIAGIYEVYPLLGLTCW